MTRSERGTTKPIAGTSFYILLALADEPRYGLGIVEEVAWRTRGQIRLGPGTLYNAIKKMVTDGLIEESEGGGGAEATDPRRRYYHITRAGRAILRAEARRLERLVAAVRDKRVLPSS